jgi:hypothetical protein
VRATLLLFSGPVETNEDLDKVPADVRRRYEKLQQNCLAAVISSGDADEENGVIEMEEEPDDEAQSAEQAATMGVRVRTRASTES